MDGGLGAGLPRVTENRLRFRRTALLSSLYGREVTVWSPATEVGAVAILIVPALLGCAALSTPTARALLWPLVEPPTDCLFRRAAPTPAPTPPPPSGAPAAALPEVVRLSGERALYATPADGVALGAAPSAAADVTNGGYQPPPV